MNPVNSRGYAGPHASVRRLLAIADAIGPDAQGRIFVDRVSAVFLNEGGDAYGYRTGIARLQRDGLIDMHESGTFFRLTDREVAGEKPTGLKPAQTHRPAVAPSAGGRPPG